MAYDYAQTFFIDKAVVKGSPQVNISAVDLYFKTKPKDGSVANPNKSGISEPGVTVLFCETNIDGTPNIAKVIESGRLDYNEIIATGDASSASRVEFPNKVYCTTDKEYAIVVQFDAFEDFSLWTNKKGNSYVGSTTASPGATDKFVRNMYLSQNRFRPTDDPTAAGSEGTGTAYGSGPQSFWVAQNDEDLKFEVFVARYANSCVVTYIGNSALTSIHEYILFDRKHSKKENKAKKGELLFQKVPYYNVGGVPGTIVVANQSVSVTTNDVNVNFNTAFPNLIGDVYIVAVSENHNEDQNHPSGIKDKFNVRKVISVPSNSSLIVDRPFTFGNSSAYFMNSAPVGIVEIMDRSKSFNNKGNSPSWYYSDRNKQDLVILTQSSAVKNSSVRFVNNSIASITINNGGSGYSTSNIIEIYSSTSGSVNAYANVTVNATGGIINTFISSMGYGMIAQPQFKIWSDSTKTANSTGSSANLSFVEGPNLYTEIKKFVLKDIEVIDIEVDSITPDMLINNPSGSSYNIKHQPAYIKDNAGNYVVNPYAGQNKKLIKNLQKNGLDYTNTAVMMSRSNEADPNFTVADTHLIEIENCANNDFVDNGVDDNTFVIHKNIINNDYTDEHTSFGNALAKHISTKIAFQRGRLAEDLFVYLRAYRPFGTDLKVYSRVYNSADPEAFDDKDWTLLECIDGADQYSSSTDINDLREFTYNFVQTPNSQYNTPGTVYVNTGNAEIAGVGTSFNSDTLGFKAGDLIKIYQPLFPEDQFITVVNSVTNATHLTIKDTTTNSSVLGYGLLIDKIEYPHQGFRNIQNQNVVRYYNTSMHAFDGYDTFCIKTVLLSDNTLTVPQVEDIRAVGTTR